LRIEKRKKKYKDEEEQEIMKKKELITSTNDPDLCDHYVCKKTFFFNGSI
jgi:hypothetical protein